VLYQLSYLPGAMNVCEDSDVLALCQRVGRDHAGSQPDVLGWQGENGTWGADVVLMFGPDRLSSIGGAKRIQTSRAGCHITMSITLFLESREAETRREGPASVCGRTQLARLFRLVLMLQSERFPNARELAVECEVSRRTIYRDVEVLVEAGVPVHYRREQQGYQLAKGFFLPPTSLDETEALALLVLTRQWKGADGLGLLRHAGEGALKLVQALPTEARDRVLAAAEPFRSEAAPAGDAMPGERQEVHNAILASIAQSRQLRVWYTDVGTRAQECTKFSPYRLLLHDRHWFLVGRSTLHRRIEVIGVPWVRKLILTDDQYEIPPRFNLERFLAQAWGVDRNPVRYRIWLRFSAQVAPELIDTVWHRSQKMSILADGRVDLYFVVDGVDEILRWVLGFGDQVEVLAPSELKARLFEVSLDVARLHRPAPPRVGRTGQPAPPPRPWPAVGG
jgi:predicted DNA-binding transcriptional regulator YafY